MLAVINRKKYNIINSFVPKSSEKTFCLSTAETARILTGLTLSVPDLGKQNGLLQFYTAK